MPKLRKMNAMLIVLFRVGVFILVFLEVALGPALGNQEADVHEEISGQSSASGSESHLFTSKTNLEDLVDVQDVQLVTDAIERKKDPGFLYQSAGLRDPFVSLAFGVEVLPLAARPPGLQGMLIQEITLKGIVKTKDHYIAMIQGTDNKSYFARKGEKLYDGRIQSMNEARVIFRREINNPLRIESFQQVEKVLNPVEEGK